MRAAEIAAFEPKLDKFIHTYIPTFIKTYIQIHKDIAFVETPL
jgi:hypothetical protein